MKKSYSPPSLRVYGTLEALTQGASTGNALDNSFPVGTPKGQITFS